MKKLSYILSFYFLSCTVYSYGQNYNAVTTAVPFLRIPVDARSSGMASTGIATTPDINAVHWNLAKLSFAESKAQINANYSPWLREWSNDMYIASLEGYSKLNDEEAIYGMIRYFKPGDLQFVDNNGNHLQSYHPNEFAIQMGYSRKLSDRFSTGLGIKYLRSDLAKGMQNGETFKPANGVAFDLGFYYGLKNGEDNGWSFGAVLSNLGPKLSYTNSAADKAFIPANLGLGVSYTKVLDERNRLVFALDINKLLVPVAPNDSAALVTYHNKSVVGSWFSSFSNGPFKDQVRSLQISGGAEYWYNNQFGLRTGYFYEDKTKGGRNYLATGASVRYSKFTANFAYLAPSARSKNNPLANTLLFGITMNLNDQ